MSAVLNASATDTAQLRELRQLVQQGAVNIVGAKGRKVPLPRRVVGLLDEILKNMQAGKAVSIVPEHQELTTQRAANMLGVSRGALCRRARHGDGTSPPAGPRTLRYGQRTETCQRGHQRSARENSSIYHAVLLLKGLVC